MEDLDDLIQPAQYFYQKDEPIKALEELEDLSFVQGYTDHCNANFLQGCILMYFAEEAEDPDVAFIYWLGSVECFSRNPRLAYFAASALFNLAAHLGSVLYYKESMCKAKEALYAIDFGPDLEKVKDLKYIVNFAESWIAESKTCLLSSITQTIGETKENKETRKSDSDLFKALTTYWAGLNLESKRKFLKVSIPELTEYVKGSYGRVGRDALKQVLASAREAGKWRFWMCRSCSNKFSTFEECKNHLEQDHAPPLTKAIPQRISKVWSRKISSGDWNPVDVLAAVEMIKNQLEDVKAFAYENGWSKDWPLAADKERSKLLQEIRSLLKSFWDLKILPCSIRDWVMHFVINQFESFGVSKYTLTDCRLVDTPQSICFLECRELSQILNFLNNVKCVRYDGNDLVSRAADGFYSGTQVKEKIDFDSQFTFLLLDKRLLQCDIARFDDEGTVKSTHSAIDYYAKAHAHGDVILRWLEEYFSGEESLRFPRPIREHNLDIWVAVMKAVQFMCRNLETKYAKKLEVLDYDAALTDAKNLCISEDEKRRNLEKDQWNRYAVLLCDRCEAKYAENPLYQGSFLNVVQDVLNEESYPTFYFPGLKDWQNVKRKRPSDDVVLRSIDHLKSMITNKVPLIDSKILLIENSRMNLLNDLTRISVFDYRFYILQPLKKYLLDGIKDTEVKATLADLFLEEELDMDASNKSVQAVHSFKKKHKKEKNSGSKMKKYRSNKRTPTGMSSLLDQNIKHELSVNLTSSSLKMAEEDSLELEDTLSIKRDRLEIPSSTDNQAEAAKDMQNMPGEDSLTKQLESENRAAAIRYNFALDMTLKAICSIKVLQEDLVHNRQQFLENLEKGISLALRNFFLAFCSGEIKEVGLYDDLLNKLLASLKNAYSMSSNAADLLVTILEFWPGWKSPERESLVTRLFLLEEYEKMSCSKCRRKPNYPEQSSYGLVVAADSIRDLKCAFGNFKFEDILKVICMDNKMSCDIKTGGCGKANFVQHTISRRPPIFTIVLEWEKDNTEKEISDTTKALDWEIDMSRLYEGVDPDTKYRLVAMIGCGEEEYICLAYEKNRWVSFRHESLAEKAIGNLKNLFRFCGKEKVRPEILFYEAVQWPNK